MSVETLNVGKNRSRKSPSRHETFYKEKVRKDQEELDSLKRRHKSAYTSLTDVKFKFDGQFC